LPALLGFLDLDLLHCSVKKICRWHIFSVGSSGYAARIPWRCCAGSDLDLLHHEALDDVAASHKIFDFAGTLAHSNARRK